MVALVKLLKMNTNNYEEFYRISNYKLRLRTCDNIGWKEIKKMMGFIYLHQKIALIVLRILIKPRMY